jgi:anti-sigma factor RsiW
MCPDSEKVSLYYDTELPSPWKEKMEAHLRECPGCRRRLEQYRNLSRELTGDRGVNTVPAAIKDRVWENLAVSARRSSVSSVKFRYRSVSIPLPLAIAAAALLILGFGMLLVRQTPAAAPQDAVLAAGFGNGLGMEVQTIPVADMSGVIQYLGNDDGADIVIIRLPESKSFMSFGEPAMIKAAEYLGRNTQR